MFAVSVDAQSGASFGQAQGVIIDASGAAIPAARITLTHQDTGQTRSVQTNEAGRFLIPSLPIGEYKLRVEADGFALVETSSFLVSVGQTAFRRMELQPAGVVEKLEVREDAEALQTNAPTNSVALGYDRIEETPSQGRNYLSFVFAAPGASPSNGANTARSATSTRNASNDSGFVFTGMRGRNNSLSIDGVDNRDETTGGNRVAVGLEMVQEFRVSATTISAEYGGAAGGILNVVTRAGSNLWHGDVTWFLQNEKLNARNAEVAVAERPKLRRYQPGVSLLGPLRSNKTFFAVAVEQAWESSDEWSETTPQLAQRILAALPRQSLTTGLFPTSGTDSWFSFKLNHTFNPRHEVHARYALSRGTVNNDVQAGENFTDRSARGSSLTRDHSFVASWLAIPSPALVNDLRVQAAQRFAQLTPNAPGPMLEIPGVLTFGQSYLLDQRRTENHYEINDNFHAQMGAHAVALGASLHRVGFDGRLANRFAGLYVFPSLERFTAARPDVFLQALGNPATNYSTTPIGVYAQDKWQLRTGLTVEAGLRYDRQWMPAGIPATNRNIAPRLGVVFRPSPASPWVLRAGWGLFYDRYPLAFLNDAIQKDGRNAAEVYLTGGLAEAVFRGAAPVPPATITYLASERFLSTYSIKTVAGVERSLDKDTTISLEMSHLSGLHLPRMRNAALTLPPQFLLEQVAQANFTGGTIVVNRRARSDLTYLLSYTAGRTRDNGSDYEEQLSDPANARKDWALSKQHQLHRVAASALWEFPWVEGLSVAPSFTYGAGRPLNALDATDSARTGAYPISSRPFSLGRNPFYTPSIVSTDIRILEAIPYKDGRAKWIIGVEAFNLFNHTNSLRVSPYYNAPNFRRATEILNARQVQFLCGIEF